MDNWTCKNRKCQKILPKGFKHKYCENCRNQQAKQVKNAGKIAFSIVGLLGSTAIAVITKGKIIPKK